MSLRHGFLVFSLITAAIGCATVERPPSCLSAEQFLQCKECTASGILEMSSDEHGFIGRLTLDKGDCLNVSLSPRRSRALLGRPAQHVTVTGQVLPYPNISLYSRGSEYTVLSYSVKDRKIGQGRCGKYFCS
jgi:hypothetical protein